MMDYRFAEAFTEEYEEFMKLLKKLKKPLTKLSRCAIL